MKPKEIYLQPECCAGPEAGQLWCEDPDPEECDHGDSWAKYVRSELHEDLGRKLDQAIGLLDHNGRAWLLAKWAEQQR